MYFILFICTSICLFCLAVLVLCLSVFLIVCIIFLFIKKVRKAKRIFDQGWERLGCMNQMDEAGHDHLDLRQRRLYSAPRYPLLVL